MNWTDPDCDNYITVYRSYLKLSQRWFFVNSGLKKEEKQFQLQENFDFLVLLPPTGYVSAYVTYFVG